MDFIMGGLLGFVAAVFITSHSSIGDWIDDKNTCEEQLPRDQVCEPIWVVVEADES